MPRRLLLAGDGGSFTPPAPPAGDVISLGITGFWNLVSTPRALYRAGKTYLGWVTDTTEVRVVAWDNLTGTLVGSPFLLGTPGALDGPIHNSPALLMRASDHRLMAFYTPEAVSHPKLRVATNPDDATAFAAEVETNSTSSAEYSSAIQLTTAGTPIYVFMRRGGAFGYLKSTDDGATWAWTQLMTNSDLYWAVESDGTRIDVFLTSTDRSTSPSSVYHFQVVADALLKSDGTSAGSPPVAVTAGTLVQDASLGTARPEGGVGYSGGNPHAGLLCYDTGAATDLIRVARWTGSAWSVKAVDDSNGTPGGFKFDHGAAVSPVSPDLIYYPRKVGSHFELHEARTSDDWATKTVTQITTGSLADNLDPAWVKDGTTGLRLIWGLGTLTSGSNFDFTVYGMT